MTKILFVCHGNICRSPMAESLMTHLVRQKGLEDRFLIASAATSREEIGNPIHPGTLDKLRRAGVEPVAIRIWSAVRTVFSSQSNCTSFSDKMEAELLKNFILFALISCSIPERSLLTTSSLRW